jgi:hypothetical protein
MEYAHPFLHLHIAIFQITCCPVIPGGYLSGISLGEKEKTKVGPQVFTLLDCKAHHLLSQTLHYTKVWLSWGTLSSSPLPIIATLFFCCKALHSASFPEIKKTQQNKGCHIVALPSTLIKKVSLRQKKKESWNLQKKILWKKNPKFSKILLYSFITNNLSQVSTKAKNTIIFQKILI